ncbi:MAG: hypothetical protein K2M08_01575 [Anaeroplasmataceae bacterium]|nr:hypothetical protein [Anaeroplasmataceae bacterium]MDE6241091.1 hypothetical protein [Anaeroplasmataceae bacterium]
MYYASQEFNFSEEVNIGEDIWTTFQGKQLILKEVYRYYGPITMQYLPFGGVQSVYGNQLILTTKSGFIATKKVIYDGKEMSTEEFIKIFPDIVNEVFPS